MSVFQFFKNKKSKKEKKPKNYRLFWKPLFFVFLIGALGAAAHYAIYKLPLFQVQSILLEGDVGNVSLEFIAKETGIQKGLPIFSISLDSIPVALKKDPWIRSVQTVRKLPSTVLVKIERHQPKLILNATQFYYINSKAEVFKIVSNHDSKDFPVLSGLSREQMAKDPLLAYQVLTKAVALLDQYQQAGFETNLRLSEVHYHPSLGFILLPEKEPYKIILGFDQFDIKLQRLDTALKKLQSTHPRVASIDLNYEGRVILTL